MSAVVDELEAYDALEQVFRQRPDTKWVVERLCSTSFYVSVFPSHPLGACCLVDTIPSPILHNKNILHFLTDASWKPIADNLCFFLCLAFHRHPSDNYKDIIHEICNDALNLYKEYRPVSPLEQFAGIFLEDLDELELKFGISIDVFEFDDQTPPRLVSKRRSLYEHGDKTNPMRLLLVNGVHLSYIKDIDSLCQSFACDKCQNVFSNCEYLAKHFKRCTGDKVKHKFPGNAYSPKPTILEWLFSNGVPVDPNYHYQPRVVFDIETYKSKEEITLSTSPAEIATATVNGTKYFHKLKLLAVGVCSNVKTKEEKDQNGEFCPPKVWVSEGDTQAIVDQFVDYLEAESSKAYKILSTTDFKEAFEHIKKLKENRDPNSAIEPEVLEKRLNLYLGQLPVVGFNSGNFDLNVLKPFLITRLLKPSVGEGVTVNAEARSSVDSVSQSEEGGMDGQSDVQDDGQAVHEFDLDIEENED